jgi:hypothetical protein
LASTALLQHKEIVSHKIANYFLAASSSNIYAKSFDGINVAGRRLAKEVCGRDCSLLFMYWFLRSLHNIALWKQVLDVVQKMAGLKKISFIAHSLGGLFARYAISILYSQQAKETGSGASVMLTSGGSEISRTSGLGAIAGLEPTNFITLATPHLGVRGKNQVGVQHTLNIFVNLF